MKHKLAMLLGVSALFAGVAAVPAGATPPPFIPPPFPAYCHGYDISTFATEFGGVAAVKEQGYTVQDAQKADQYYCKTGILLPAP
jgi:hypothetical protein